MTAERKPGEWVTGDAEDFLNDEGRPMERKTEQRCGRPGCACTCHMAESERARYLLSGAMPFGAEVCICPLPTESGTERCICGDCDIDGCRGDCGPCWSELDAALYGAPSETPSPEVGMPDQRSVTDQLRDLKCLANERGMYDAADWLSNARAAAKEQSK